MTPSLAFMLGELEIGNLTAGFLVVVALVFVGSFAVVSLQTGELIKPPKNDCFSKNNRDIQRQVQEICNFLNFR